MTCKSGIIGVIKDPDGNIVSDPVDHANCFNDFFGSVFTVDNDILPHTESRVP